MDAAKTKMDAAFEFFEKLGAPFFSFHDIDIAPEGSTFAETCRNLDEMIDLAEGHMERTGVKLLWGTTNAFSHPRFMAGAATNPDPAAFRYAAAQVAHCMNATHRLGGANYVLWGGREGYETLLNTDMKREIDHLGRFMNMVVEHKHATGFEGTLLIEPKPMEPTKHQYDYDVATVYAFLQKYGLNNGIFGSIDANAGDDRLGWDLDRFPVSVEQMTLGMLEVLRGGGFDTGGLMFDCKLRRQSVSRDDLFIAHVGAMDVMARSLLAAAAILEDGTIDARRTARYAGWEHAQELLDGTATLQSLHDDLIETNIEPDHTSGRQELLEGIVARQIDRVV